MQVRKASGMHAAVLANNLGPCNRRLYCALYLSPNLALGILAMFLMGAWTSRSAGCIINDYFDRNFDSKVERCKTRPLASG